MSKPRRGAAGGHHYLVPPMTFVQQVWFDKPPGALFISREPFAAARAMNFTFSIPKYWTNCIARTVFILVLASGLGGRVTGFAAPGGVSATTGRIELPTYPWAAVRHPYFRST